MMPLHWKPGNGTLGSPVFTKLSVPRASAATRGKWRGEDVLSTHQPCRASFTLTHRTLLFRAERGICFSLVAAHLQMRKRRRFSLRNQASRTLALCSLGALESV